MNSSFASSAGLVIDTDDASGSAVEQVLDLLDLDAHAAQCSHGCAIRCSYSVDRLIESMTLPSLVEQATGAGEEDDLVRLQHLHQLVGGEIGVDVEDLTVRGLAERGDHRDRSGLQARLDRREVDARDLADQAVDVAVEILRFEHAGNDRGRARVDGLQRLDEPEVRCLEHAADDRQRRRRGHAQAVDGALVDARGGISSSSCGPAPCTTIGVRPDLLQERRATKSARRGRRAAPRRRP